MAVLSLSLSDLTDAEFNGHDFRDLPILTEFKSNQAMLADVVRYGTDLLEAHKGTGVNVLKADGSSSFRGISEGDYESILWSIPNQGSNQNALIDQVWLDFDE